MKRRRAFSLLIVLLFSTLLTVLALAYLTRTSSNYSAANYAADGQRAYELAMAGLENARVRLDKDSAFPPCGPGQPQFSCWEAVYEPDGTTVAGSYLLTVDTRWAQAPYHTLRIVSVGCLGPPGQPRARRKLWTEVDVDPAHTPEWKVFGDEGSL